MSELHVFITTTNGNGDYLEFKLMFSAGKQNAGPGYVGTITSPEPVKNITFPPTLTDPVFFSYPYNSEEGTAIVRGISAKIISEGGDIPSSCTLELLELPDPATNEWTTLSTGDITLKHPTTGVDIFTNPQGIAIIGGYIFGLDYDSRLLTILGVNELVNKSGNYTVQTVPYDMSEVIGDENARVRAVIALGSKLYSLFINYYEEEEDPEEWAHSKGYITRFDVSGTALSNSMMSTVGKNPQEVVPGIDEDENVQLFIPAIGGEQLTDDADTIATNGIESNICVLPAEGAWAGSAPVLLTGDTHGAGLATAYDIHDLGIVARNGDSPVFILTAMYGGADYYQLYYRIYLSTVNKMLSLRTTLPDLPPTLSEAAASGAITVIDEGVILTDKVNPVGLYHPSINIIQHPTDPEKDLVVLCTGSTILITRVLAYGSRTAKEAPEPPEPSSAKDTTPEPPYSKNNPYTIFANAGGVNMNSIDITRESLYQAERKNISLKHGGRMIRAGGAAARLGTRAPAAPAKGEGEGEK